MVFHRVQAKSEGSRFFRAFSYRRPCYVGTNLTSGGQTTYYPGNFFKRCFVTLTTTSSPSLSKIWGGAIFCCWLCLTSQDQAIRCLVKCSCMVTSVFICYLLTRFIGKSEVEMFPTFHPYRSTGYSNNNPPSDLETACCQGKIFYTVLCDPIY